MAGDDGTWDVSPDRFEKMVADIESVLGPDATIAQDVKLVDRDGEERQIDVLLEFKRGDRKYYHAIECRRRRDAPGIEWIDALKGKYRELDVAKVTAVSAVGFTEGAKRKARAVGIEVICLAETDTRDWRVRLECECFTAFHHTVEYHDIGIVLHCEDEVSSRWASGFTHELKCFELADGGRRSLHDMWMANVAPKVGLAPPEKAISPRRGRFELRVTDELPVWVRVDDRKLRVEAIRIDATYAVTESRVPFLRPRQYEDADSGRVRAGCVETAEPVTVDGRDFYVTLHYVPLEDDTEGVAKLMITQRPVDGDDDTLCYPAAIYANVADRRKDSEEEA